MKKRLKLPNGFGSVVYYGDSNRRQPYVVKKTISGRQKNNWPVFYLCGGPRISR